MIEIKKGNIFTTECQTIVNPVNCIGVMGAGIAYEFKLRFPEMYQRYKSFCENGMITIGNLWIYKINNQTKENYDYILSFPTKNHWKYPSKVEYLEKGLEKFVSTYKAKGISSVAFPLLGADRGGLSQNVSIGLMERALANIDINVEIWKFDPRAQDDLYIEFKVAFLCMGDNELKESSGLRLDLIKKLKLALNRSDINSMSGLLSVKGIGEVSLEKAFAFIRNVKGANNNPVIDEKII
jgi:O-acetyl-ADP-ribose deacetylase (regulator of RNase III)